MDINQLKIEIKELMVRAHISENEQGFLLRKLEEASLEQLEKLRQSLVNQIKVQEEISQVKKVIGAEGINENSSPKITKSDNSARIAELRKELGQLAGTGGGNPL